MKKIRTPRIPLGIAMLMMALGAPMMKASTTYTYTGNDYNSYIGAPYTSSDSVDGYFTFASPLADNLSDASVSLPTIYSLNDGVQTITGPLVSYVFNISTDSNGNITNWDIWLYGNAGSGLGSILTACNLDSFSGCLDQGTGGSGGGGDTVHDGGTWAITTTSSVPEPSTVVLMSSGLLALALLARKGRFKAVGPSRNVSGSILQIL
jgi:hypothetical protein